MSRIEEFFKKSVDAGIIPQTPMNYDAVSYKIYTGYLENKIDELTAKNAELRATSRAEVVERAFDNIMKVFHEMLSTIFPSIKIDLDEWKKDNLAIAEKELAEEEGKQ